MRKPVRLRGPEPLEARALPSSWGIPWADPNHLTLSFVPDGTATPFGGSSLSATLAPTGTTAVWQREVLRAFQTWAVNANIDIGLVSDGGQAFGGGGAVQGDSRFGDIRVAAAPLTAGVVSNTSPFSWTGTTFSGDMLLNANMPFVNGTLADKYDLFTVAMHEAGHSFGFADQFTNQNSVMWGLYQGTEDGLSASDVAALQALYGVRGPDAFDAAGSNDTLARASAIPKASGSGSQLLATGDITTNNDVDYYKFTAPALTSLLSVVVRLKASGISLLTPTITVYNSWGQAVGSAASTDPLNNDVTVRFSSLLGGTYYVKVQGARADVFGIGGYKLAVDYVSLGGLLAPLTNTVGAILDGHTNDVLSGATLIPPRTTSDSRFDAIYRGVIEDATDVDFYRISTAKYAAGTAVTLNVIVWGLDADPLDPRVRMFDAAGNPVAFQVLANDTGVFSLQVLNATAGTYYVQVTARNPGGAHGTGSYFMGADFNQSAPTVYDGVAAGSVGQGAADTGSMTLEDNRLLQFALAPDPAQPGSTVTMTVYDDTGAAVLSLTAVGGQPTVTTTRYLRGGNYTIRYTSSSGPAVNYSLFLLLLSDEVGPYATSTASPPSSDNGGSPPPDGSNPPPDSSYTYSGSSTSKSIGYGYTF
jgi:Matrixin